MGWAKLTDRRAMNPKLRRAGFEARGLDEAAICQVAADETDGVISEDAVEMLAVAHRCKNWRRLVAVLVEVRRWEPVEGGWIVKGYLRHNPSRADREADRERKRAAGKAGGIRSGEARAKHAASDPPKQKGKQAASDAANSRPVPVPVPPSSSSVVETHDPPAERSDDDDRSSAPDPYLDPVADALALLAARDLERRLAEAPGSVAVPEAWLLAAKDRRQRTHGPMLENLRASGQLRRLTPEALADLLEPPPTSRHPALVERPDCARCEGSGWVSVDGESGDVIACDHSEVPVAVEVDGEGPFSLLAPEEVAS